MVDLSAILSPPDTKNEQRLRTVQRIEKPDSPLDDTILLEVKEAIRDKNPVVKNYKIHNTNRSVGTKLAGEIAYLHGDKGLPDGTIELRFKGSAGQSFGAFLVNGIRMILVGEANDYVGKGMCGGEIVIMPPFGRATAAQDVIVGNTVMYGATGGTLFASGRAGERFCVRNSGGLAVIEGVGDHGCEYMTNGTVVILGATGKNFGAGMTGGTAYVFDADGIFKERYNKQLVGLHRLESEDDVKFLQATIYRHLELTDSQRAREILNGWREYSYMFWKVVPFSSQQKIAEVNKALDVSKESDTEEAVNQKQ
jgi:glutamate synthase (NADPH/NADH) large chain/glutamate synthase (ferredoxin)